MEKQESEVRGGRERGWRKEEGRLKDLLNRFNWNMWFAYEKKNERIADDNQSKWINLYNGSIGTFNQIVCRF